MRDVAIVSLHLYPVKGCRALEVPRATAAATGLAVEGARDREWMVVDAQGRFVTQREHPRMALIEPLVDDGTPRLRVPGNPPLALRAQGEAREVVVWRSPVRGFDAGDDVAGALSTFLGADVRLVRFDDALPRACNPDYAGDSGATTLFADGYPLLVIGQASLDALNERLATRGFPAAPMNRFRPNVVVAGLEPHGEDRVDRLVFGDVVLRPVKPCTRCVVTTTDQASGERYAEPLRTLATYRRDERFGGVTFGVNAIVASGAGAGLAAGMRGTARPGSTGRDRSAST